jgi:hypothetical protein
VAGDDDTAFNPSRRLCPDGACVGIISGGKCTICGAADEAGGYGAAAETTADTTPRAEQLGDDPSPANPSEEGGFPVPFDPNRRLCSDDNCIGVIGQGDRCSVCGKPSGG